MGKPKDPTPSRIDHIYYLLCYYYYFIVYLSICRWAVSRLDCEFHVSWGPGTLYIFSRPSQLVDFSVLCFGSWNCPAPDITSTFKKGKGEKRWPQKGEKRNGVGDNCYQAESGCLYKQTDHPDFLASSEYGLPQAVTHPPLSAYETQVFTLLETLRSVLKSCWITRDHTFCPLQKHCHLVEWNFLYCTTQAHAIHYRELL